MKKLMLDSSFLEKGEMLTRAQLKKVFGGRGSGGSETCTKQCECENGETREASIEGCDQGTCDTSGDSAYCRVDGAMTFHNCPTVCQ